MRLQRPSRRLDFPAVWNRSLPPFAVMRRRGGGGMPPLVCCGAGVAFAGSASSASGWGTSSPAPRLARFAVPGDASPPRPEIAETRPTVGPTRGCSRKGMEGYIPLYPPTLRLFCPRMAQNWYRFTWKLCTRKERKNVAESDKTGTPSDAVLPCFTSCLCSPISMSPQNTMFPSTLCPSRRPGHPESKCKSVARASRTLLAALLEGYQKMLLPDKTTMLLVSKLFRSVSKSVPVVQKVQGQHTGGYRAGGLGPSSSSLIPQI